MSGAKKHVGFFAHCCSAYIVNITKSMQCRVVIFVYIFIIANLFKWGFRNYDTIHESVFKTGAYTVFHEIQ